VTAKALLAVNPGRAFVFGVQVITLCDKCFPDARNHEQYTIIPFTPCEECGEYDDRQNGGVICQSFPIDPRPPMPPSIQDIDKKTLGIVRFTENSGRVINYQVTIDPEKKSPSGQFMRFGTHEGDELTGWMPLAGLVLVEVLSTDWVD
jgi:hypothetical protein